MSTAHGAGCVCCAGLTPQTPLTVTNRPGMAVIASGIGSHADFRASLLARLAASPHPALRQLTTRRDDDFAIALCDAWATIADVLMFYQERIATESYLRTATERRSVAELARLIDYALRPGVAASTHLAFTLETAAAAPEQADIATGTRVMSVPAQGEKPQTFETVAPLVARGAWNSFRAVTKKPGAVETGATCIALVGAALGVRVGDRLLFVGAGRRAEASSADWQTRTVADIVTDRQADRTTVAWQAPLPVLGAPVEVHLLRQRAPLFGHNAPDPRNLAATTLRNFANDIGGTETSPADWKFEGDGFAYLDGAAPGLLPGGFGLLHNGAGQLRLFDVSATLAVTRRAYALTAPATRLSLTPAAELSHFHGALLRGTTVWFDSERVRPADVPVTEPLAGDRIDVPLHVELPAGRVLLIAGIDAVTLEEAGEVVTLLRADNGIGATTLILASELKRHYIAGSAIIYGNVAPATHGETVHETLGSGNGSVPYQRVALRQAPLTYVPARTATGAAASLELRVNDMLWREARSLYGAAPDDRVYVLRHGEAGTHVQFGDGVNGERPPSGQENITATYRKGTGSEGMMAAAQLSQLITRPLGVKAVVNPLPAAGAEPPESVAAARANCTLTVHTLDRIVSLQDYEDHARAFAGIAKAAASWFWNGRRCGVFLTVAGHDGATIDIAAATRADLIATLRAAGDPHVPVDVRSYTAGRFGARIAVATRADVERDSVIGDVRAALLAHFGFASRRFGQPVTLDEVLAAAQAVDGVVAAHVTRLGRGNGSIVQPRITAEPAVTHGAAPFGAELLTLDPARLELTELA
ncbi:putative baseplate assembly protein [soil metagenome]